MHALFFSLKRAYHGTLRLSRQVLPAFQLTAARFDMLYAIDQGSVERPIVDSPVRTRGVRQSDLRRILGVSAPTVTVMLRALVKLGWVARARDCFDRRTLVVWLTATGRRLFRRAFALVFSSGLTQLAVDCALTRDRPWDVAKCIEKSDIAEGTLINFRESFRSGGSLVYPWHVDDE